MADKTRAGSEGRTGQPGTFSSSGEVYDDHGVAQPTLVTGVNITSEKPRTLMERVELAGAVAIKGWLTTTFTTGKQPIRGQILYGDPVNSEHLMLLVKFVKGASHAARLAFAYGATVDVQVIRGEQDDHVVIIGGIEPVIPAGHPRSPQNQIEYDDAWEQPRSDK